MGKGVWKNYYIRYMPKFIFYFTLLLFVHFHYTAMVRHQQSGSLTGRIICIDAGHGGTAQTDSFRVGPSGEREEWINLRVALLLQEMLEEKGAKVIMARVADVNIPLAERARLAMDEKADVFLSIHHNATADPDVNFPIIYFHGNASENIASVALGKHIAKALAKYLYQGKTPVSLVSDHTIFPTAGTKVLRDTYGMPGVIAEASFFTNPKEEVRLQQPEHNRQEAMAYVAALEAFFEKTYPSAIAKNSTINFPPFEAFQEAERMSIIARSWQQDFLKAKKLMERQDTASLRQAYELFTHSARSFPDSYVAGDCHRNRSILLKELGNPYEAQQEKLRAKEYYVPVAILGKGNRQGAVGKGQ